MIKKILQKWAPNPFEKLLEKAQTAGHKHILIAWNRGLGDVALGLYAMVFRIRQLIPDAKITFLTREDLKEGFSLLENVKILTASSWRRNHPYDVRETLRQMGRDASDYDLVIEKPDPTQWVSWQLGKLTPKLKWDPQSDNLWRAFPLHDHYTYIGIQPQTETHYGYEKNWPLASWKELTALLTEREDVRVILFGHTSTPFLVSERIIDLRGKTTLLEMLSIIKNRCQTLIVPDSGVLSLTYYLDTTFPLKILSLWADPRQGVMKQNVSSPNPELIHWPLVAAEEDLRRIAVHEVFERA